MVIFMPRSEGYSDGRKGGERVEKKGKGKKPFLARLGQRLEVDAEMIRRDEWIEIRGRSRVELGGVKKIVAYSETDVRVALKQGTVQVQGRMLECVLYRRGEVAVEGDIRSVCFLD